MIYFYYVVAYAVWIITIRCWQKERLIGYDPEQPHLHDMRFDIIMMMVATLIALSWVLVVPLAIWLGEKR